MDENVQKLKSIWGDIPKVVQDKLDLTQVDSIANYLSLFQLGEGFYIIFNTLTAEVEYVSPSVKNILGINPNEFHLSFVMDVMHPDDLPYYLHYEKSAVRFFSQLPFETLLRYKFAYDFRVKDSQGQYKRLHQQVIPIEYFPEGGAKTLGIFTDLTYLNIQGIPKLSFIGMKGEPSYYNVHLTEEFMMHNNALSTKEVEILQLVVKGYTSEQIAELLNRSVHTVRNHRKSILQKSGCDNVQELIVKAIREGWV